MIWGPHPKYGTYIIHWFNFETGMWRISIVYFRPPFWFFVETSWSQVFKWPPTWLPKSNHIQKKTRWFFWEKTPRIRRMRFHHHHHHETACHVRRVLAFPNSNFKPLGSVPLDMPFWRGTRFLKDIFDFPEKPQGNQTQRNRVKVKGIGQKMIDQYTWILI